MDNRSPDLQFTPTCFQEKYHSSEQIGTQQMTNIQNLLSTAARWDRNYYKTLHKAIREHGGMKSGIYLALLFGEDCYDFNAVSVKARQIWRRKLMRVVSENAEGLMDGGAIMLATFVD